MAVHAPVGMQTKEQHILEFCKLPSLTFNQNTTKRKYKTQTGKHSVYQQIGHLEFMWNALDDQMVTEFYLHNLYLVYTSKGMK